MRRLGKQSTPSSAFRSLVPELSAQTLDDLVWTPLEIGSSEDGNCFLFHRDDVHNRGYQTHPRTSTFGKL